MTPPPGNDPIAMSYSDLGQSDRLSNGTQSYQNDQTGISAITDTVAKTTTSYTRTPDGQLISERIPTGATGCPTGGPAVCDEYYLFDGLGSVVALTDSHGAIVNSYSYDPYGNATATETVPNPFRFTGAIWDSQTGLYKMGERFYDPVTGRLSQPDPFGEGYQYVSDDSTNYADPSGLCSASDYANLAADGLLTAGAAVATAGTVAALPASGPIAPLDVVAVAFSVGALVKGIADTGDLAYKCLVKVNQAARKASHRTKHHTRSRKKKNPYAPGIVEA